MSKLALCLRSFALLATLSAVALFAPGHAIAQSHAALHGRQRTELFKGREVAAGQVIVKFSKYAPPQAIEHARSAADAGADRAVGGRGARLFQSRSKNVETLVRELSARGDVVYAEPNYVVRIIAVPNDPSFREQWALQNTGYTASAGAGTPGADIGVVPAWDISTGSRANVVAVVDTGVDYNHPDLAANIWSAPAPFTVNLAGQSITCPAGSHGFDALTNTCDPMDDYNHGTHVAGTVGAVGDNGVGVSGVNQTASIMGLRFLDAQGNGTLEGALNAIEFAIQAKQIFGTGANVRVLSNSWGWNGEASQALLDQINRAAASDMLFVAGAGNSATDDDVTPFYPASYDAPTVVSVAATDGYDRLANTASWGSNYGRNSVDLAAPGNLVLSTVVGGSYDWFSGTSMATPHVSGAAALVLSRCSLDTTGLKSALLNNVDYVAALSGYTATGGRLNVNKAIRSCAAPTPTPVPTPAPTATPTPNSAPAVTLTSPAGGTTLTAPASVTLSANASDGDGFISRVDFYAGAQLIGAATASPFTATWGNVAPGTYSLTAVATDDDGAATTSSTVSILVNRPPSASVGGPYGATAGQAVQFNGGGSSDQDGTISSYHWNFGDGTTGTGASPTHAYASAGSYAVTLTVTDNLGATGGSSTTATISEPPPLPPAAPTNLSADGSRQGEVLLRWSDRSANELGFDIERSTSSSTGFVRINSPGANATAYTDRTVQRRQTYYYRVRARNNAGTSGYSNTATVRTK